MRARRAFGWLGVVVLLELVVRSVVYGMAPSATVTARALGGDLGGPGFVAVLLVAGAIGAIASICLVWLASLGVRERWALAEDRPPGGPPRIELRPLLVRALALTLVGWLTFAGIETVVHLRAGLGFHGLECLVGPVHRNALPVVGAFALLASALASAAAHVAAWMRRTVGGFARPRATGRPRPSLTTRSSVTIARRAPLLRGVPPRGPPLPVV
jgi:hypothetical protein